MEPQKQPNKLSDSEILDLADRVEHWAWQRPASINGWSVERFVGLLGPIDIIITSARIIYTGHQDDKYELVVQHGCHYIGRIEEQHRWEFPPNSPRYHGPVTDRYKAISTKFVNQLGPTNEAMQTDGVAKVRALLKPNTLQRLRALLKPKKEVG